MTTLPFSYQNTEIQFIHSDNNILVNATQMAKIFEKQVEPFTRNESTQNFIKECLKSENSRYLNLKNESDLIDSRQKSGTFMHRILALKFAAWLDPKFELWVFSTIDKLMMEHYHQHRQISIEALNLKKQLQQKETELFDNPLYIEYATLKSEYISAIRKRAVIIKCAYKQIELEF